MLAEPTKPEVDHRTLKLLVGVIAITLGSLTDVFSSSPLESISASYHEGGWPQTFFVGFLFAIAAFLAAYNGKSKPEMILAKVAALAALGVAMFPCQCGDRVELVRYVHGASAAVMFVILACFCYIFFKRARSKEAPEARLRELVYVACGVTIVVSIVVLAFDTLTGNLLKSSIPRLTFYGETAALIAFGTSWLTASRTLPVLTGPDERFSPLNGNRATDGAAPGASASAA